MLNKYDLFDEAQAAGSMNKDFLGKCARIVQLEDSREQLRSKKIYVVYLNQVEKSEDSSGCHLWRSDGKLRAKLRLWL